ncbi:MAG TPA: LysR family transcriptional regulator [Noviherbaspirillum sp.]|nr:LysR family transcriptional regulator [Noviherbaspirillum sp.]
MHDRLDLNSLRLYYDVVNAGSITRAAEQLRTPKSTISRKLAQLEQDLGVILLKKGPKRLAMTDIGAALYDRCRRLVIEIEDVGQATAEMQGELRGLLRVSIPVDFGISWISRAIAEFVSKYPDIHLEIEVNSRAVNPREDPYDLTIQLGPLKESGLTYRRLATITRGVYASPDYLEKHGMPRTVEDFGRHNCIITDQQRQDGVWTFRNQAKHRFIEVFGKVTVNNIGIARDLAINGVGLSMLPNIMCQNDVKAGRLVRVLTNWESPPAQATALILSRKGIPNKTRVFLDFLAERLTDDTRIEVNYETAPEGAS